MSRKWTLPTLILSLCSSGALQANPLDSPGIVYIDGLPWNRACQSYMAASDRALSARHREERERIVVEPVEAEVEIVERAPRPVRHDSRCRFPARRAPAWRRRTPRHRIPERPPPPGSQANRPAMKFRQSRRSCHRKKPRLHRGARSANCKAPPRRRRAKPDVAAPPATTGIAALPAAAGAAPALAPQAEGASVAAATPAEPAKSEPAKSDAVKSEAAAPPPAGSEITVPPATLEIAALPAEAGVVRALPARTIQQQVLEATGIADRVTAITLARDRPNRTIPQSR